MKHIKLHGMHIYLQQIATNICLYMSYGKIEDGYREFVLNCNTCFKLKHI